MENTPPDLHAHKKPSPYRANKKLVYKNLFTGTAKPLRNFWYSSHRVKKLTIFFSFSYPNFEDTVTNFDKDMFRTESLCSMNSYS